MSLELNFSSNNPESIGLFSRYSYLCQTMYTPDENGLIFQETNIIKLHFYSRYSTKHSFCGSLV